MKQHKQLSVTALCLMGILSAVSVVLSRLGGIQLGPTLKISFSFLPIALCGMLLGPLPAAAVATVADVIGALLFPSGTFFIGYTLVALLGGLLYGLWLRGGNASILRLVLCTLSVALICNILLNSLCMCLTGVMVMPGNEGFWPVMSTRIIKNLVQTPVNALMLFGMQRLQKRLPQGIIKKVQG